MSSSIDLSEEEFWKIVRDALNNYHQHLEFFLNQSKRDLAYHESLYTDLRAEINRVAKLLAEVGPNASFDKQKSKLIDQALDYYAKDLEALKKVLTKQFPNIPITQGNVLLAKIQHVKQTL